MSTPNQCLITPLRSGRCQPVFEMPCIRSMYHCIPDETIISMAWLSPDHQVTFSGCPQDFLVFRILGHKNMEKTMLIFQNRIILGQ